MKNRISKTITWSSHLPKSYRFTQYTVLFCFVVYLLIVLSTKVIAEEKQYETPLSKSKIEDLIQRLIPEEREKGAKAVLDAIDSDTSWAVNTILTGIRVEEEYLANSREYYSRDVYIAYYNFQKYVRDLALLGLNSAGLLQTLTDTLSSDQKTWAKIALGYGKDPTFHEELRQMITGSPNVLHKAMAAEAIAAYEDESDVEILHQAFLEGNSIDWKTTDGSCIPGFSPVAIAAHSSLEKLGYTIDLHSLNLDLIKMEK